MSMSTKVFVQFNGTEVSVKLSPNSAAKVFIDGAEFDIRPTRRVRLESVQTGTTLKKYGFIDTPREETLNLPNYAFIDTPREETVNLPNHALIDEVVITGFYGPPPPHDDDNEFSKNISPPAYSMGLPPPYDPKDPNRIKRRKLREYYLPNYMEIEGLDYLGPGCMCAKCAMSNGEIFEEKGTSCELWDYDEYCIGGDYIERFHMTSRRPYWCSKTMKRRPCWCTQKILWELNSFLM